MYPLINFGLLVLIWLVQLIVYPSMRGWRRDEFSTMHRWYTRWISVLVIPLMVLQTIYAGAEVIFHFSFFSCSQIVLIGSAVAATLCISKPLHHKLSQGFDRMLIDRIISTNWLRTAAWTLVSIVDGLKALW